MIQRPFTVQEASEVSGMSPAWWRQKIFRKEVKYLKIGKKVLIPQETVEEILTKAVIEPRNHTATG